MFGITSASSQDGVGLTDEEVMYLESLRPSRNSDDLTSLEDGLETDVLNVENDNVQSSQGIEPSSPSQGGVGLTHEEVMQLELLRPRSRNSDDQTSLGDGLETDVLNVENDNVQSSQ